MAKNPAYRPLEQSLQQLWQLSELDMPKRFGPSIYFNSAAAAPLIKERNPRHIGEDLFLHAMGFVGSIDIKNSDSLHRRIVLGGYSRDESFPQLAFELSRNKQARITGCQVSIMPAAADPGEGSHPPKYRIADLPEDIFTAEAKDRLSLSEISLVSPVYKLALATGAVLLNAASHTGYPFPPD